MTARPSRLIAFALLLALVLGGLGHPGRGAAARIAGLGPAGLEARLGVGGLHDLCVTPRADAPAVSLAQKADQTPAGPEDQPGQGGEHCADCLVRAAAAPPPHWPAVQGPASLAIASRAWSLRSPEPKTPANSAHGARAPPPRIA